VKCAACGLLKIHAAKFRKKSPSAHHRIALPGYSLATEAYIDNPEKKLYKTAISPSHVLIFSYIDSVTVGISQTLRGGKV